MIVAKIVANFSLLLLLLSSSASRWLHVPLMLSSLGHGGFAAAASPADVQYQHDKLYNKRSHRGLFGDRDNDPPVLSKPSIVSSTRFLHDTQGTSTATIASTTSKGYGVVPNNKGKRHGKVETKNNKKHPQQKEQHHTSKQHLAKKQRNKNPSSPSSSLLVEDEQYEGVGRKEAFLLTGTTYSYPRPSGAASKTTLVSTTSATIEIRTKAGDLHYRGALKSFFNSTVDYNNANFDTRIAYDEYEDRLVIASALLNIANFNESWVYVAVSKTGSPKGPDDWYTEVLDIPEGSTVGGERTLLFDLRFQLGPEALFIGLVTYGASSFDFYGENIFIVAKQEFYSGGTVTFTEWFPLRQVDESIIDHVSYANDLTPAHVYGGPIGNNILTFLVLQSNDLNYGDKGYLFVVAVQGPPDSADFSWNSLVEIKSAYGYKSAPAPQIGTTTELGTENQGVYDVAWRNNTLWIVIQTVPRHGPNANQTTASWIKIKTDIINQKFIVEDQGEIGGEDIGAGTFTLYPSVAVNSRGVAAFGFSASGPLIHPGAYVVGRTTNDPNGTVSQSFVVKEGTDIYNSTYWAISSSIVVDPVDDSFWAYNSYANKRETNTNSSLDNAVWGTAWRHLRPPGR